MAKSEDTLDNNPENYKRWKHMHKSGNPGVLYGLGFIGAAVYFIQHATTLGAGLIGILKAIIWPALLVYKFLELIKL